MGISSTQIEIPQTKEYGWDIGEGGKLQYKATRKAVLNRITFIANVRGATVENSTTGFQIEGVYRLSESDLAQVKEEIDSLGIVEVPEGVTRNESGREEPNFE